jgi:fermentation-respiration switch protein FrsA (DUF1100 family)
MLRRACGPVLVAIAACALPCQAQTSDERRNWFDDPFFQMTAALADCPLPAGPFITAAERQVQAHHRAERGTTCWLAGQCDRPNDYAYDQDIAAAFRSAWAQHPPQVGDTTLWVTVQGRVVYLEGCATRAAATAALEAFANSLPNVRQAIANLRTQPSERAPYPLRSPR